MFLSVVQLQALCLQLQALCLHYLLFVMTNRFLVKKISNAQVSQNTQVKNLISRNYPNDLFFTQHKK